MSVIHVAKGIDFSIIDANIIRKTNPEQTNMRQTRWAASSLRQRVGLRHILQPSAHRDANISVHTDARTITQTLIKGVPSLKVHRLSAVVNKSCLGAKEET